MNSNEAHGGCLSLWSKKPRFDEAVRREPARGRVRVELRHRPEARLPEWLVFLTIVNCHVVSGGALKVSAIRHPYARSQNAVQMWWIGELGTWGMVAAAPGAAKPPRWFFACGVA
jgi:hypothetical protein